MRKVLQVAWRDYKATVCTKAFIIGLVVAPLFMSGSAIVIAIMKSQVDTRDRKVAVIDRTGCLAQALVEGAGVRNSRVAYNAETGEKVGPAYVFEIVQPDAEDPERQKLEPSDRVRARELHGFLVIGATVLHPRLDRSQARIDYHSENPVMDEVRQWVATPINDAMRRLRLADAGIEASAAEDLFDWIPAQGFGLVSVNGKTGAIRDGARANEIESVLLPMIPVMLMFLLVMMGAMPQLQSVTEEKSQRIAEVLLGCVRPFELMMGKLLGGAAVSLTGAFVYVVGGILAVSYLGLEAYIPYDILPWFFAFLVCAIFLFGAILAALGSACNDATEAQSVTFPAMLPMLVPLFTLMPVLKEPNGAFATGLSFVPLFTPLLMPLRQGTPAGIPGWQPWVGLILASLTAVLFVWIGGRVFRVAILIHGTPPKLKNLLKWALRG